jgi:DNA-binding NarL/FixJ family response regulator
MWDSLAHKAGNTAVSKTEWGKKSMVGRPNPSQLPEISAVPIQSIRVYLVTGSRFLREALVRVLRKEPDLTVVGDQAVGEALAKIVQSACDVLVMDSGGPQWLSQVVHDLRSLLPNLKVILLSMDHNELAFSQAVKGGIADYLLKEASVEDVITAIRVAAHSEAVRPSLSVKTV